MVKYCSDSPQKCGLGKCISRGCIINDPPKIFMTLDQMVENYWQEVERLEIGEFKTNNPVVMSREALNLFATQERKRQQKSQAHQELMAIHAANKMKKNKSSQLYKSFLNKQVLEVEEDFNW